jgi:hypothetical protein
MLRELLYELSRGLAYRRIRHSEMQNYTLALPIALYAVMLGIWLVMPVDFRWLGEKGIVSGLLSIISTLPGFYFAGLAAVATFGGTSMDTPMPAPTPEIDIRVRGSLVPHPLSRRQFLSYLFSYLVVVSFGLCFVLLIANSLADVIPTWKQAFSAFQYGERLWSALVFAAGSAIALIFSSMIVTTLHGIFFLTEKMHQP